MAWVTPATITAGQTAGVAAGFATWSGDLAVIGGPWTAYTPTTGGLTLTSGTLTGRYLQVGKTVDFFVQFTFGASSAVTSGITFTLPATAAYSGWYAGDCGAFDSSAASDFPIVGKAISTTVISTRAFPGTAGNALVGTGTTVPFTWAVGDIVAVAGRYEAA